MLSLENFDKLNYMDSNSRKVLKYISHKKNHECPTDNVISHFSKLPKDYIIEIISSFKKSKLIKFQDENIRCTNKGSMYLKTLRNSWIKTNIVDILALIIAIAAFIVSIFALFKD